VARRRVRLIFVCCVWVGCGRLLWIRSVDIRVLFGSGFGDVVCVV